MNPLGFLYVMFWRMVVCVSIFSVLTGCTTLSRENAVPPSLHGKEQVNGMPGIRYQTFSKNGLDAMLNDIRMGLKKDGFDNLNPDAAFLSISGGGDNGAFGAGLLTGWTEHGDRPKFSLVTGVSTGAMIAPFAFLGPDYDFVLKRVYTQVDPGDIFVNLGLMGGLFGDAFADTAPLYHLISEYVNEDLLKKIAYEYQFNNRWLLVATTNLDSGIPVVWNMGKLAAIGTPESLTLFRKILLASAAIPGVFPPVMIDVEVEGKHYQEMHVDGGASVEVFLYPVALGAVGRKAGILNNNDRREEYIIRNARLDSEWKQTERNTLSIMGRAVDQLIEAQGYGDLYRIFMTAQRDKIGFNLAYIGTDFDAPHIQEFDRQYMNSLYQYSHNLSKAGYPWAKSPPGYMYAVDTDVDRHTELDRLSLKRYKYQKKIRSVNE